MERSNALPEILDLLNRRWGILACLLEEPRDKRTLVDELDIPRSTLDRAIRELESVGVLMYREGEYTITPVGKHLTHGFSTFLERTEQTLELEPFLQWVSVDEFSLDPRYLSDAELSLPSPNDPYAMVNRHVEALKTANTFRGMLPLVGLHGFETSYERIVQENAHHEIVTEQGVLEMLRSEEAYSSKFRELCTIDRFDAFVCDSTIPYFVGIFDNEVVQIGVDDDGEPRALLETERPEVRTWAHDTIDEYERRGSRVLPTDLESAQSVNTS